MKIALYIEDGLEQIVLTPETPSERSILGKIHDGTREMTLARGSFYECRGGWTRWKQASEPGMFGVDAGQDDDSTMIVLRPKADQDRRGEG